MAPQRPLVIGLSGVPQELKPSDSIDPVLDTWLGVGTIDLAGFADNTFNVARTYYVRILRGPRLTISKIGLQVGNTAAGNIAVAVHRNTGTGMAAAPGEQATVSSTIACPAANSYAEVPLGQSVSVAPGDWLALANDSTSARFASQVVAALAVNMPASQQGSGMCPATPATLAATIRRPALFAIA